jgi:RecB family exonuclease
VLGLTERVFPDRVRQDPLLSDAARQALSPRLDTQATRSARERRLLHEAIGVCRERVYVSYSRLDVSEARARVPSFYALDVVRGVTGRLPRHHDLARASGPGGPASLAWPAPHDPSMAIDRQEHDLAVLRDLLVDGADASRVRGRAQYLLRVSPVLRRAVVERWARASATWTQFDGLMRVTDGTRAALAAHRLTARPYSVSALQRFSACPYQFLLSAVHRLHPPESAEPPQTLDPLTRGSLVHRVQALTLRALREGRRLPLTPSGIDEALATLDIALTEAAEEFRERLAPAIARVWADEIASVRRDLRGWMRRLAAEEGGWEARYIELGFGLPPSPDRDGASLPDPVAVDGRFALRGAVDLVEAQASTGGLRVTDHKTGKDRTSDGLIIGGGNVLQPVLYAAVVERALRRDVTEARLSFCTVAGGYRIRPVGLTPHAHRLGVEALEVIDRAVETGTLLPAPAEGACRSCDFRLVCGPSAAEHAARKSGAPLRDLLELRGRP